MIGLLRFAPWLIAAAGVCAAAFLFWQNGRLHEENGALKHSNQQLENAAKEKENAAKNRQRTNADVKRMPPADKLDRLR